MNGRDREIVTLADRDAAWNFHIGQPVECVMMPSGGVRLATRRERLWRRAVGARARAR